jgi:hypothetical protein
MPERAAFDATDAHRASDADRKSSRMSNARQR